MHTPQNKALAYLENHNVMTLATAGPDGLWAAAVFYVNSGFNLYFISSPTSRHSQNIAHNPQVAGTIQEDYSDWPEIKGIQFEGQVRRIKGTEQVQALGNYGAKFPIVGNLKQAPTQIVKAMSKVSWYRVQPTKLYFVDNSIGFGHRDEIPLE